MAIRVRHKVNLVASADTNGRDRLFALDDALAEVTLDGMQEISSGQTTINAGNTASIPFGEIGDARGCLLKASGDFLLSVNGSADQISARLGVTGLNGAVVTYASSAKVFLEAALSSLEVEVDADAEDIVLTYAVWGDPVS